MSLEPAACDRCLRRAWLVGSLAGHIERATADSPGKRSPELLALPNRELAKALDRRDGEMLAARASSLNTLGLRGRVSEGGGWACCRHDPRYPEGLRGWDQAPAVLFARGKVSLLERLRPGGCVTVVGARRASSHGRGVATELGRELAAAGLVVISGMALGVDSCAHAGALEAGGATVAVLGSGPDVPHPASKRRLWRRLGEEGLVLSELPPGQTPRRWTFPARNRIMAALAAITVVVEARCRSGSLITASMAQDLGREVGAVPGAVGSSGSEGTNSLLRDGAQVIRGAQDVLDSLLGPGAPRLERSGASLEPALARVLDLVDGGCSSADAVAREGRLAAAEVAGALTRLELLGFVRSGSGGGYERTQLTAPAA
ncbi:MAG: DNA-protecting protein DprA [Solirubrobacterales bacterium]|nr:DNA-protecting protein DprA [Solirubrobacterales bacterium]